MRKKILVLGGARFHGARIVDLLSEENEVYVLNRGNYRKRYPHAIHINADRQQRDSMKKSLEKKFFDIIIDNNAYNAQQITDLFDAIADRFVHYIFTSTAASYLALTSQKKLKEEETPKDITKEINFDPKILPYALNKLAAEKIVMAHPRTTIIRPPNVYGEKDPNKKLKWLYEKIKTGLFLEEEINRFSLIYFEDLAKVVCSIAGRQDLQKKIFNIADSKTYDYNSFFTTIFGSYPKNITTIPAKELWNSEHKIPFAWGPQIDTSRLEQAIGNFKFTPIEEWGPRSLQEEIK